MLRNELFLYFAVVMSQECWVYIKIQDRIALLYAMHSLRGMMKTGDLMAALKRITYDNRRI